MNWLEETIFKWRWLDDRISQWRLWYFRAFKGGFDQIILEQELSRKQQKRWQEERKRREAGAQGTTQQEAGEQEVSKNIEEDVIPKNWLCDQLSLQQAEAVNTASDGGVPFNKQNDRWERLKSSLRDGDQIWSFCSSPESWEHLAGRAGFAIVREGRVVDSIITIMN